MYFNEYEFDLGECEFGFVLVIDYDFDMFVVLIGFIKIVVFVIMKDEGNLFYVCF